MLSKPGFALSELKFVGAHAQANRERVARTLKRVMQARGVKNKDLARRLNATQGRVSQILSGRRNLTLDLLSGLAEVLGMELEVLLVEPRCPPKEPPPDKE